MRATLPGIAMRGGRRIRIHCKMTIENFSQLGLVEPLSRALAAQEYRVPTPIQAEAIPLLLAGRDLLGIAQTGTGKTAAFALPILQSLSATHAQRAPKSVRALVLAPTRELALQIGESFAVYGRFMHLKHAVILGGVSQGVQVKALARGVDILVATPGRLLDLARQHHLRLDQVTHLVLDEADRMLDMGFIRDIRQIAALVPKKRQTMLFSATMPKEVAHLAADLLHDPKRIEVTPESVTVDLVDQKVMFADADGKRRLLLDLLADRSLERVIVFTRTKHRANRISDILDGAGIASDAIHGNKSQNARQRALERFRNGEARVLVATDIAARGIDVDGITHVINFELPNEPESYVHRIGRTARAGASGTAISLCDATEMGFLRDIEKLTQKKLHVVGGNSAPTPVKFARPERPQPRKGNHNRRRKFSRSRAA
jgi:ATP-dependent RNA helicase RhlE